jgi:hypothetical protein
MKQNLVMMGISSMVMDARPIAPKKKTKHATAIGNAILGCATQPVLQGCVNTQIYVETVVSKQEKHATMETSTMATAVHPHAKHPMAKHAKSMPYAHRATAWTTYVSVVHLMKRVIHRFVIYSVLVYANRQKYAVTAI